VIEVRRLELFWWTPRATKRTVVGVTNRDVIDKVYYAIAELDYKYPISMLIRCFEKRGLNIAMIYDTRKGYHIYTSYCSPNPRKVVHKLYRTNLADRGHLSLAILWHYEYRLVLRVSKKYENRDIFPRYINKDNMTEWHEEVAQLIEIMQGD